MGSSSSLLWLWVVMILVLVKGWCCLGGGCLEQERIALLQLKANINYPNGTSLPSWFEEDTVNCCKWERVECNTTTGHVSGLFLNNSRNLMLGDWYFNASLFLPFEGLTTLNLSENSLAGWVENEGFERISRLRNLELLDLSVNRFNNSVLSYLGGLSSLKYLYLRGNGMEGLTHFNGFRRLAGLYNLEVLDLSVNQLNDSIQSFLKLDDFINLKELDLSQNQIESFESVQVLHKLEVLKLSENNLNNSVFPSLRGLVTLRFLGPSHNHLKGSIDVKELYALSSLEELDVSENEIENFTNFEGIKSMEQLKVLHLNQVKFNASNLPKSLSALSSLKTLYLQNNELKGAFTAKGLRKLSNLEDLFLGVSSLDNDFLQNIGVLTSLKVLSLFGCWLGGTLPTRGWCDLKNLQELDLSDNQLGGDLPKCLENLTYLRVLDLSYNTLTGNIASSPLSTLKSLEYLSLSSNHFHVPVSFRSFANHSNLKVILCDKNILMTENELNSWAPKFQLKLFVFSNLGKDNSSVALPSFLYYQYDLRIIDLSYNNFNGTFPNWLLENNTRLEGLYLNDNSFVGPLKFPSHPNPYILAIDISNNKIEGRIPPNISPIFPNLRALYMSGNAFDGNLISPFHDMNALVVVDFSNNNLSGVMPEYFVTRCPSLHAIILSNNNFSGQITPTTFNQTKLRHLYLDGNNFIGNLPNSLSFMSLETLDVSHNHFSGDLPRWLGNMTYITEIVMSQNHFQGPIPIEFCQLSNLLFLDLSENNLSGNVPSCFSPSYIEHVHLYKNRFEGPMPLAFYNSSFLITLDLRNNFFSGSIPTWISRLFSLTFLLLKDNNFEGNIPSQLCQLNQLTIMDLSQNNLSGSLPPCLGYTIPFEGNDMSVGRPIVYRDDGYPEVSLSSYVKSTMLLQTGHDTWVFPSRVDFKQYGAREEVEFTTKRISYSYKGRILTFMSGIDFSCNQLTGEIPPEIGNLRNIHSLNLSHNYLTGSIPTTFSNLRQVESLDLSYNNLNGRIPSQLIELKSLAIFSIAHNNISGPTPDQKFQFATFDENSYEGNPFLCGPPLHNNCSGIRSPSPMPNASNHQGEEDGLIDIEVFHVSFVASYITVLFGILVVLYINPYWRQKWFYLIETCIIACYYFVVDNCSKLCKF